MNTDTIALRIFYDSHCPLCMKEMQHLRASDLNQRIDLVDLHDENFSSRYPMINKDTAMGKLHGQLSSGEMIYGLDVTCVAWSVVGKYRWLKILRAPVIKPVADVFYKLFARYRSTLALLLTGKRHCTSDQCKF